MSKTEVLPDWRIIILDETSHWLDKGLIARCGDKIKGVYFFDANRHVHCCEFTPSFELEFIESIPEHSPEDDSERDQLQMDLQVGDCDSPLVIYAYVSQIDLGSNSVIDCWEMTQDEWQFLLEDADGDDEQTHSAAAESCREMISQNGLY